MALDKQAGVLTTLNCGDSRSLIFDGDGKLIFQTVDHKPNLAEELERLSVGQKQGLSYSLPQCRFSRWYLPVGEYEYAVSRSLEGPFATARGIVYTADITDIQITDTVVVAVSATDGLFEVMDTAQVGQIVHQLRTGPKKMTAADAAKTLCSMAVERGSSDNVSVVILYLDE
jgi:serine/threonine protein phosphatase PrpC